MIHPTKNSSWLDQNLVFILLTFVFLENIIMLIFKKRRKEIRGQPARSRP
jgi:hypothetical protein